MTTEAERQTEALTGTARLLAEKYGIIVHVSDRCCTNGKKIYIPTLPPSPSGGLVAAIRGFLDHEVGHIIAQSDMEMYADFRNRHGEFGMDILNGLDDLRVETVMEEKFAGTPFNIHAALDMVEQMGTNKTPSIGARLYLTHKRGKKFDGLDGMDDLLRRAAKSGLDGMKTIAEIAEEIIAKLKNPPPPPPPPPPPRKKEKQDDDEDLEEADYDEPVFPGDDDETENSDEGNGRGDPEEPDDGEPEDEGDPGDEQEFDEEGEPKDDPEYDDAEGPETQDAPEEEQKGVDVGSKGGNSLEEIIIKAINGRRGSEVQEQGWQTDWFPTPGVKHHILVPFTDGRDTLSPNDTMKARGLMTVSSGVRQGLTQLVADKKRCWWEKEQKSGALDMERLHALSSRTSVSVFKRKQERIAPSAAVCLAIDHSGSMGQGSGKRHRITNAGRRIDIATNCALIIGTTLEKLGVPFSVIGFPGPHVQIAKDENDKRDKMNTDRAMPISVIKSWTERMAKATFGMVNLDSLYGSTPTGAAVCAATELLGARTEDRKLLIILTDGGASDYNLLAWALRRARQTGITSYMLGISYSVSPMRDCTIVPTRSVEELPGAILGAVRAAVKA